MSLSSARIAQYATKKLKTNMSANRVRLRMPVDSGQKVDGLRLKCSCFTRGHAEAFRSYVPRFDLPTSTALEGPSLSFRRCEQQAQRRQVLSPVRTITYSFAESRREKEKKLRRNGSLGVLRHEISVASYDNRVVVQPRLRKTICWPSLCYVGCLESRPCLSLSSWRSPFPQRFRCFDRELRDLVSPHRRKRRLVSRGQRHQPDEAHSVMHMIQQRQGSG